MPPARPAPPRPHAAARPCLPQARRSGAPPCSITGSHNFCLLRSPPAACQPQSWVAQGASCPTLTPRGSRSVLSKADTATLLPPSEACRGSPWPSAARPGPATPLGAPSRHTPWHLPPCRVQATHPSAFGACAAVPRGPSPSSAPRLPGWVPAGGAPGAMGWLQEEAPPRLPWAFSAAFIGGPSLDNTPQSRCPRGLSTAASRTHSEATGERTPGSEQPRQQRPPRSRPRCCGQGAPQAGPSPSILQGRKHPERKYGGQGLRCLLTALAVPSAPSDPWMK